MRILHISDIHCNFGNDFNEKIFNEGVKLLNKYESDFVFISGDLTTEGLLSEYELARKKLQNIDNKIKVVSGNHDERNLGYRLFPEFFGKQSFIDKYSELCMIGLSSSEPDKDDGRLGRERHNLIEKGICFNKPVNVIGFHHHLIPVPNSGRENNIIEDSGETLDIILKNKIPLVLMGHRHVPYGVKIHNTLLVNAGTFSSNRTRAYFSNTFNIIEINKKDITIKVVDIVKKKEKEMIKFNQETGYYSNKYYD